MVQYWVLKWSEKYASLLGETHTGKLLAMLGEAACISAEDHAVLCSAYMHYCTVLNQQLLQNKNGLVNASELAPYPEQVRQIWQRIFES